MIFKYLSIIFFFKKHWYIKKYFFRFIKYYLIKIINFIKLIKKLVFLHALSLNVVARGMYC